MTDTSGPDLSLVTGDPGHCLRQPVLHAAVCSVDYRPGAFSLGALLQHHHVRRFRLRRRPRGHLREVEQSGEKLPEVSYGRRNRQAIAAREARVAARLRAIECAYRTAIGHDAAAKPEPAITSRANQILLPNPL